jgi:AMP nucleosidase
VAGRGARDGPCHDGLVTLSVDFSAAPAGQHAAEIRQLCDAMEAADRAGRYPRLTVERPWSAHNPVLEGEFASPRAIRWYLERELGRLAASGARIAVCPGREALDLHDRRLGPAVDETRWDLRRKKLFLFAPERMALSIDRLQHYTGTAAELFQRYVLLTNYSWHVEEFHTALPGCTGPDSDGRQMPAWHHMLPGRTGVTIVNIGVGASNAKTITDHLAVLRPDLLLMIGHCAGLRNHQDIGDLVLATGYVRDDRVLDDMLPLSVPVVSNYTLNTLLLGEVTARRLRSRMGIVYTTANRNWELHLALVEDRLRLSRALAVDMESATVATNGFRYRIPTATLLAVSDKPLHPQPKLSTDAQRFYAASRRQHVEIAISVAEKVRRLYPDGLPAADLRSPDEPLLGTSDHGPDQPQSPGDVTPAGDSH